MNARRGPVLARYACWQADCRAITPWNTIAVYSRVAVAECHGATYRSADVRRAWGPGNVAQLSSFAAYLERRAAGLVPDADAFG